MLSYSKAQERLRSHQLVLYDYSGLDLSFGKLERTMRKIQVFSKNLILSGR